MKKCPLGEVQFIGVHRQDHTVGVVSDDGVRVSGGIVEELVDVFNRVLCGGSVLRGKGPDRGEHREIDGACIVKENSYDFLDNFLSALERRGESSSSFAYCTFCPYAGLTWG